MTYHSMSNIIKMIKLHEEEINKQIIPAV